MTKKQALQAAAEEFGSLEEAVETLQELRQEKVADAVESAAREWGSVTVKDWPSVDAFLSTRPTPDEAAPGVHRQLHKKLQQALKDRSDSELFSLLLSAVKAMKPLDLYEAPAGPPLEIELTPGLVVPGVLGG